MKMSPLLRLVSRVTMLSGGGVVPVMVLAATGLPVAATGSASTSRHSNGQEPGRADGQDGPQRQWPPARGPPAASYRRPKYRHGPPLAFGGPKRDRFICHIKLRPSGGVCHGTARAGSVQGTPGRARPARGGDEYGWLGPLGRLISAPRESCCGETPGPARLA